MIFRPAAQLLNNEWVLDRTLGVEAVVLEGGSGLARGTRISAA